jgi:hypothetical protein
MGGRGESETRKQDRGSGALRGRVKISGVKWRDWTEREGTAQLGEVGPVLVLLDV